MPRTGGVSKLFHNSIVRKKNKKPASSRLARKLGIPTGTPTRKRLDTGKGRRKFGKHSYRGVTSSAGVKVDVLPGRDAEYTAKFLMRKGGRIADSKEWTGSRNISKGWQRPRKRDTY